MLKTSKFFKARQENNVSLVLLNLSLITTLRIPQDLSYLVVVNNLLLFRVIKSYCFRHIFYIQMLWFNPS